MLHPIIKEQGITKRERYLAKLADETFFGLWSYPNIYTNEGITKNLIGKEFCDLFVIFGETIILFSDKDIKFNETKSTNIAWKRWFNKSIVKSCAQLYGAESWIKKSGNRLFLDKECKENFHLDFSSISQIHLIAVTCNSNKPAQKYLGGSSSLFQNYLYDHKDCLDHNFTIGDLYPDKTFVHVLDEFTLDLLISELSTIADFINYLTEKTNAIRSKRIIAASGEEEILSLYFQGRVKGNYLGKIAPLLGVNSNDGMLLESGLWTQYKASTEYFLLNDLCRSNMLWDDIVNRFSESILTAKVGHYSEYPIEYHERALRHMASESRVSRYLLSTAFDEKFNEVPIDKRSSRLVQSITDPNKIFIFLFFPRKKGLSDGEYREHRTEMSYNYVLVSRYLRPEIKLFLVVSTEPKGSPSRSEDILGLEYASDLSDEEIILAKKLHTEERILNHTWTSRKGLLDDFESKLKPKRNLRPKYKRNDKCPCGSGKKYKKCCR